MCPVSRWRDARGLLLTALVTREKDAELKAAVGGGKTEQLKQPPEAVRVEHRMDSSPRFSLRLVTV